jgi:hypothetical protein
MALPLRRCSMTLRKRKMMALGEKRRQRRISERLSLQSLKHNNQEFKDTVVYNTSVDGYALESQHHINPKTIVEIEFGDQKSSRGVVQWCNPVLDYDEIIYDIGVLKKHFS